MDFIVENSAAAVIDKISFNDLLTFTLFRDGQSAVSRREKKLGVSGGGDGDDESRFNSMRISELLQEAHEKGFNVDGSREMLIAALKAVQEAEVDSEEDSEESDDEPEETWGIACYFSIPNSKAQMIHLVAKTLCGLPQKRKRRAIFAGSSTKIPPTFFTLRGYSSSYRRLLSDSPSRGGGLLPSSPPPMTQAVHVKS